MYLKKILIASNKMRRFNRSSKKWMTILFSFIYILSIVNAQSEDFSLNSNQGSSSVCPGTTTLFITEIINTGSSDSEYTVNTAGSASKWALSVPTGFILRPGEKKNVYTYVTPKSSSPAGSYTVDVSVSTSNGLIKRVSYTVNVRDCYGVTVSGEQNKQICPCELTKYDFVVKNTGEFQETYRITVSGSAASYVKLSESSVTLQPGESKTIFAYLQNLCTLGSDDFTITATGREVASFTSSAEVNSCFDYSVTSDKDFITMCDHTTETLPIGISNKGSKSNEYALSIDGPAWANLEKTGLVLGSGQSASIKLILSPDYNEVGNFNVNFKAVSQLGEVEAVKPIIVNVKECNKVAIELKEESDRICAELGKSYQVIIKNTGEVKNDYKINLDGPGWASLDKQLVSLNGGDEASLNLNLKPEKNDIGKRNIIIKTETLDQAITSQDEIQIEVVSSESCFKPEISMENDELDIEAENSATIPITIKNSGVEDASYELSVSGDAASFSQLNPSSLKLNAGESETVYLYVAPTEDVKEGLHKATITAKLENSAVLDSQTVDVNVKKTSEKDLTETSSIESEVEEFSNQTNQTGLEDVTGAAVGGFGSVVNDYKYYIISAFIILIIVILLLRFREKKLSIEQWEKEVESDNNYGQQNNADNMKLFGWIAAGVIVAVFIVLGWMYAGFVRAYISYIITGIVLLIVALFLLKYKNSIVKFFEEESSLEKTSEKQVKSSLGNSSEKKGKSLEGKEETHSGMTEGKIEQPKPAMQPGVVVHKSESPDHKAVRVEQPFGKSLGKKTTEKSSLEKTSEKQVKSSLGKTSEKDQKIEQKEKKEQKPAEKKSDEELYY